MTELHSGVYLALCSAGPQCSAALIDAQGALRCSAQGHQTFSGSRELAGLIHNILAQAKLKARDLEGVCVAMGPGSYTGLRIGLGLAKGLCLGASLPLFGINTLATLWRPELKNHCQYAVLPTRGGHFACFLDRKGAPMGPVHRCNLTPVLLRSWVALLPTLHIVGVLPPELTTLPHFLEKKHTPALPNADGMGGRQARWSPCDLSEARPTYTRLLALANSSEIDLGQIQ